MQSREQRKPKTDGVETLLLGRDGDAFICMGRRLITAFWASFSPESKVGHRVCWIGAGSGGQLQPTLLLLSHGLMFAGSASCSISICSWSLKATAFQGQRRTLTNKGEYLQLRVDVRVL